MLKFTAGRFTYQRVNIEIPEGFYLNTTPALQYETGLVLLSPDEVFQADIMFCEPDEIDDRELCEIETCGAYEIIEPVSDYCLNSMCGEKVVYVDSHHGYIEMLFKFKDYGLSIIISTISDMPISEILKSEYLKELLDKIYI